MRNNMIVKVTFKSGRIKVFNNVFHCYYDSIFETVNILRKNFDEITYECIDVEEIKIIRKNKSQ